MINPEWFMPQIYSDVPEQSQLFIIFEKMVPDYAHKIFGDKRINYSLLMVTLAMDTAWL